MNGQTVSARPGPRVSVIMPVHNAAATLEAAVASVLCQDMGDLELLIVDDASTDGSAQLAAELAGRDCRIRCFRLPTNRGQSVARNLALDEARGVWVAPVDADDEITPDRFSVLCAAGEREDAALIADRVLFKEPKAPSKGADATCNGGPAQRLRTIGIAELIRSDIPLNGERSYGYLKPLMRREFLDRFELRYDDQLRFAEDLNLYARIVLCGGRFLVHPQSYYVYHQTPVSASRDIRALPGVAEQALVNNRRLEVLARQRQTAGLDALLHDHRQRWETVLWFNQLKLALRQGRFDRAVRLTLQCPSSISAVVKFAKARSRDRKAASRQLGI